MMFRVVGLPLLIAVSTMLSAGCGGGGGGNGGSNDQPEQVNLVEWEKKVSTMSNNDAALEYTKIALEYYRRKSLTMASQKLKLAKDKYEELKFESNVGPATTVTVLSALAPAVYEIESRSGGRKMLDEASKAANELKDDKPEQKAKALMTLAVAQHKIGEADDSKKTAQQAEKLAQGIDDKLGQTLALASLAEGYQEMEKADETTQLLNSAKTAAGSIEEPGDKVNAFSAVANVEVQLDLNEAADATYKLAQDAAEAVDDPLKKAYSFVTIGENMVRVGLKTKAFGMAKLAEKASDKVTDGSLRKPLTERISRLLQQCQ